MKKIAYIEIDNHAEIAQAFMDIIKDSEEFTVDYYFSGKIINQVEKEDQPVFLSDSSMILDQLKTKSYDLIIIGTMHRYFNVFRAIVQKYNTSIIVHNLNFAKASKTNIFKSVFKREVIYRLKLWWKEGLFYSTKNHQIAKNLLVLDAELSSERHTFLPLFYSTYSEKPANDDLLIVIPGGVSQKRRDYEHVFNTIKNLKTTQNINFVFLGKAKDRELKQLKELSSVVSENIKIKYFPNRVSLNDFNAWMQCADVLWCPIQQETEFFSQKEIYGVTKMTGNIGDAIKYGKMAVFPRNYPSKSGFIFPEEENIIGQFNELKSKSFDFDKDYNKKVVLKNLEKVLKTLIIT